MSNFTLYVGVQGYLLPCSLPGMVSKLMSSTCLGTVNKYKTYFICLNMLSQTLYRTLASCITCACQSYNSIMIPQYSYKTTAPNIRNCSCVFSILKRKFTSSITASLNKITVDINWPHQGDFKQRT